MPIWSLTAERLEKLKDAIVKKKQEHDDLEALSEKDLWCKDLDDFSEEWDNQLKLDNEIQTNIRRTKRRVSKKIGAGTGRKLKDDDDFEPPVKTKGKPKAAAPVKKVETKSAQRFADMFGAKPAVKKEVKEESDNASDGFSDDDFAALSRNRAIPKPVVARSASVMSQSEEPEATRNKRVAASKAKTLFDVDSDSEDDDNMLGDVGNLVKGIGKSSEKSSGRLSLHAMSRPESSHEPSSSGLPKTKTKSSKALDVDSPDETNYELLAKSSPHKSVAKSDDIDSFLSDDEPAPPVPAIKGMTKSSSSAAAPAPAGLSQVKKARGRPAAAKAKAKEEPVKKAKAAPKSTALSPAAKAYAAKKAVKKQAPVGDSDEDMAEPESLVPRPAARSRPGRAAAARKPVIVDEDSSMALDEDGDDSDNPFDMD